MSKNTAPEIANLHQQNTLQPPQLSQSAPSVSLMLNEQQQDGLPSPQGLPAPSNMGIEMSTLFANSPNRLSYTDNFRQVMQNHLEALKQLREIVRGPKTPQMMDQVQNILRNNPALAAEFRKFKQLKLQQQLQRSGPFGPQRPPIPLGMGTRVLPTSGMSSSQPNPDQSLDQLMEMLQLSDSPQQQQPQIPQQQQHGSLSGPQGPRFAPPNEDMQVLATSNSSNRPLPAYRQSLQRLLQVLRMPSSPQQQNDVLQVLKENPQLMAVFIKQRQQQQQQQHVQQRRHL